MNILRTASLGSSSTGSYKKENVKFELCDNFKGWSVIIWWNYRMNFHEEEYARRRESEIGNFEWTYSLNSSLGYI